MLLWRYKAGVQWLCFVIWEEGDFKCLSAKLQGEVRLGLLQIRVKCSYITLRLKEFGLLNGLYCIIRNLGLLKVVGCLMFIYFINKYI